MVWKDSTEESESLVNEIEAESDFKRVAWDTRNPV